METLEARVLLSAAPLNLAATPASESEINLTWDLGDANDTAIVIERKIGAGIWYDY